MATSRICSIPDCGKPRYLRGWCNAHYLRWRRHGDPLGGRTGRGKATQFLNEVVLPYDGDDCLIWPFGRGAHGYASIRDSTGRKRGHRLVCEIANGPPPTPEHESAHSCGKGHLGCVTKRHLSWKTRQENIADKVLHGTAPRGERNHRAILTEADVREIRARQGTATQAEIGAMFGVSQSLVGMIHSRKIWKSVD